MPKGIIRKLAIVKKNLKHEMYIPPDAGKYERGLSGEGYLGGYRQAIYDVELALNGGQPNTRSLWDDNETDNRTEQ